VVRALDARTVSWPPTTRHHHTAGSTQTTIPPARGRLANPGKPAVSHVGNQSPPLRAGLGSVGRHHERGRNRRSGVLRHARAKRPPPATSRPPPRHPAGRRPPSSSRRPTVTSSPSARPPHPLSDDLVHHSTGAPDTGEHSPGRSRPHLSPSASFPNDFAVIRLSVRPRRSDEEWAVAVTPSREVDGGTCASADAAHPQLEMTSREPRVTLGRPARGRGKATLAHAKILAAKIRKYRAKTRSACSENNEVAGDRLSRKDPSNA